MALTIYTTFPEAIDALDRLLIDHWNALSNEVRERLFKLRGVGGSPVERVVHSAEFIYAHRDDASLPLEAKAVAAGLFRFGELNGFSNFAEEFRGSRAAEVLEGNRTSDVPDVAPEFAQPESKPEVEVEADRPVIDTSQFNYDPE